jgi:transcriptional regulator with XRE-family HTH domain
MARTLGAEIRRLRLKAGFTLRGLAGTVGISPAHLSDIELGWRLPSDRVLRAITKPLGSVGATDEGLKALDPRLGPELEAWVQRSPEIIQLLRECRASRVPPKKLLQAVRKLLKSGSVS